MNAAGLPVPPEPLADWIKQLVALPQEERVRQIAARHESLHAGEINDLLPTSFEGDREVVIAWKVGHDYWQREIRRLPDADTCWSAAKWFVARGLTYEWFVSYPADFAWYSRDAESLRADPARGLRPRDAGERFEHPTIGAVEEQPAAMAALIGAMRLRFEERYQSLRIMADECLEMWPDDPMFFSLAGLAELGAGGTDCAKIERALAHPKRNGRIEHVCLHAYYAGDHLPDQGRRIVHLADQIADQDDLNLRWRRAYGYRKLGQWEKATRDIEYAFRGLTRHHDLRQIDELIRERELVS